MKLPIKDIKPNDKNPRYIKDDKFKKLVQSLKDFPEMAEVREVVINKDNVILGGNMRFKAMVEAGWTEIPVKIVDWSDKKQKEFIIKDNVAGGEWDWGILANEWDIEDLQDWGLDTPSDMNEDTPAPLEDEPELSAIIVVAYDDINDLDKITDFYELEAIDITDKIKEDISGQRKAYVFKKQ